MSFITQNIAHFSFSPYKICSSHTYLYLC